MRSAVIIAGLAAAVSAVDVTITSCGPEVTDCPYQSTTTAWPEWDPASAWTTTTTTTTTPSTTTTTTTTTTSSIVWPEWDPTSATTTTTAAETWSDWTTSTTSATTTTTTTTAASTTWADWTTSGSVVYPVSTSAAAWGVAAVGTGTTGWTYSATTPAYGIYTGGAAAARVGGALAGVAGVAAMLL